METKLENKFYTWQGTCGSKNVFEFYLSITCSENTTPLADTYIVDLLGEDIMKIVESYDTAEVDDWFDEANLSQHFYIEKHLANTFRNYIESIGFKTDHSEFGKGILEACEFVDIKEPLQQH